MTRGNRWSQPSCWAGLLVVFAAALLYLLTLDNGLRPDELVGGDLITHQYAQVEGRLSNAPGYPLYTMGGWLWFRLGWQLLRWAANPIELLSLYSLLWGVASLAVLYVILLRVTRGQWPTTMLLTAFYAATYFFWYYSVTTEQYASTVLQTLLVIWLAFRWDERPRDSLVLWLAFLSGTMLANMLTTLFILPPLLWFILFLPVSDDNRSWMLFQYIKKPGLILKAIGAGLLPLISYAYVYIRGAQHPEWRGQGQWDSAWRWFIHFLTIPQGRDELAPGLTLQHFFTAEFPSLMWQELTWVVFLGGLIGLAFLGRRRAIFLYSTLVIYFIFCWGYRFGNWFQVIIPAYPIFIIGFAAGLTRVSRAAGHRRRVLSGIYLLLVGLVVYRFSASLPRANQRDRPDDTGLAPGWAILADNPQFPAIISATFEERVALQYLKTVWRVAPDIYPTAAGEAAPPPGILPDSSPPHMYITRRAAAAAPQPVQGRDIYPQAAGEQLIELLPEPRRRLPPTAAQVDISFGDNLRLAGWESVEPASSLPVPVGQANWQIALYWETTAPLTVDYTVSVRPLVDGQLITVGGEHMIQDHQPVWGTYPTSRWRVGEIVRDVYALSLPDGVRPEAFQVVVYFATETGFENIGEALIQ